MDRTRLIAMAVIASAALVAVLLTWWYIFIYQPGRVRHDAYARPDTAVRLAVQPAKIQWYITKLAPGITKYVQNIPRVTSTQGFSGRIDWIHAMPYEISMLFHHDTENALDLDVFINTHPNDPDFGQLLARAGFFRAVGWAEWATSSFSRKGESTLLAEGKVHIRPDVQQAIAQTWNSDWMMQPPVMQGGHFIELSVDNSGGVLLALHRALMQGERQVSGRDINSYLLEQWPDVSKVHLWANLVEDDLVRFEVEVQCRNAEGAQRVERGLDYLRDEFAYEFDRRGFGFTGHTLSEGARVRGTYEFFGFEAPLRRALGS